MRVNRGGAVIVAGLLIVVGCGSSGGLSEEPVIEVQPEVLAQGDLDTVADQSSFADVVLRALIDRGEPDGPYTLFAPRNGSLEQRLESSNRDLASVTSDKVLANLLIDTHLVDQELTEADLRKLDGETITMVSGNVVTIVIEAETGRLFLEGTDGSRARVIAADVDAGDGTVHFIDEPLLVP